MLDNFIILGSHTISFAVRIMKYRNITEKYEHLTDTM